MHDDEKIVQHARRIHEIIDRINDAIHIETTVGKQKIEVWNLSHTHWFSFLKYASQLNDDYNVDLSTYDYDGCEYRENADSSIRSYAAFFINSRTDQKVKIKWEVSHNEN